jgi:Domain of unknown function (DUF2357)/PD-(D/E)XK nuclease superfamily
MATLVSGADTWLTINDVALSFRGDENLSAGVVDSQRITIRPTSATPYNLEIYVDDELLEILPNGSWLWSPKGFAGLYRLKVSAPGYGSQIIYVRVLPSKFSYDRYRDMLDDISRISEDLLFQLHSHMTEKALARTPRQPSSALREYELVKGIVDDLDSIMSQIRRNPHRSLATFIEPCLLDDVYRFTDAAVPLTGPVVKLPSNFGSGLPVTELPQLWNVQRQELTFDVFENQLLRHFLWRQLLPRINSIFERAEHEIRQRALNRQFQIKQKWPDTESEAINKLEAASADCQRMRSWSTAWGSESFLKHVKEPSHDNRPTQVLQKNPHYNRFYRLYLLFQRELKLTFNLDRFRSELSLRRMSELYETWSVFRLTKIVLDLLEDGGYQITSSNGFFKLRDDQFHFEVDHDAQIELNRGDIRILIRYEPRYPFWGHRSQGMVAMRRPYLTPDLGIEIWREGRVQRALIFDPKYKVDRESPNTYVAEDLDKMDTYLNNIRWQLNNDEYPLKVVSSAYILYPGEVLEHNIKEPETGALPLVPKAVNPQQVVDTVRELLRYSQAL